MPRVLPLLLLLTAACARQESTFQITFDPCEPLVVSPASDTTASELDSVGSALQLWNARGLTQLTLDGTPQDAVIPLRFQDGPAPFHGLYEDNVGDVLINRQLSDPTEASFVVAHELGHAMGLHHVSSSVRASVMNPDNTTLAPTAEDSQALTSLWSCPAH